MLLAFFILALVGVAVWLHRRERRDYVSAAWIQQHRYTSGTDGSEQPRIRQWPIRKVSNEIGWWNTQKLRKRA